MPYEKFYNNTSKNLYGKALIYFNKCKKLANQVKPLAFYLYNHSNMIEKTQKDAVRYYNNFMKECKEFTADNLTNHYKTLDIAGDICSSTLKKEYSQLKRIGIEAFGINEESFEKLKFTNEKAGREESVTAINPKKITKVVTILYNAKKYRDSLLVHLMYTLAARPNEMLYIKFEDFNYEDEEYTVYVYQNKTKKGKTISISQLLYNQVMEYKELVKKISYIN
jgi:integrase